MWMYWCLFIRSRMRQEFKKFSTPLIHCILSGKPASWLQHFGVRWSRIDPTCFSLMGIVFQVGIRRQSVVADGYWRRQDKPLHGAQLPGNHCLLWIYVSTSNTAFLYRFTFTPTGKLSQLICLNFSYCQTSSYFRRPYKICTVASSLHSTAALS